MKKYTWIRVYKETKRTRQEVKNINQVDLKIGVKINKYSNRTYKFPIQNKYLCRYELKVWS